MIGLAVEVFAFANAATAVVHIVLATLAVAAWDVEVDVNVSFNCTIPCCVVLPMFADNTTILLPETVIDVPVLTVRPFAINIVCEMAPPPVLALLNADVAKFNAEFALV